MNRLIRILRTIGSTKGSRVVAGLVVAGVSILLGKSLDIESVSTAINVASMLGLAALGQDAASDAE